jgi:hypothetical protein
MDAASIPTVIEQGLRVPQVARPEPRSISESHPSLPKGYSSLELDTYCCVAPHTQPCILGMPSLPCTDLRLVPASPWTTDTYSTN